MPKKRQYVRKFEGQQFRRYQSFPLAHDARERARQLRCEGWLTRVIKEKARMRYIGEYRKRDVYTLWRRRKGGKK